MGVVRSPVGRGMKLWDHARVVGQVVMLASVTCGPSDRRPSPPTGYGPPPPPPGDGRYGGQGVNVQPDGPPGGAGMPPNAEVRPGHGARRADADCTNGEFRDFARNGEQGCCTRFCPPGVVISRAIEAEQQVWMEGRCSSVKCSVAPPSPCPAEGFRVTLIPRCERGRCVGEVKRTGG
jgi:hypothetical protein